MQNIICVIQSSMNDAVIKTDNKDNIITLNSTTGFSQMQYRAQTEETKQSLGTEYIGLGNIGTVTEIQYWPNPRLYGAALFGYNMDKTGPVWPPASKLIYSSPGQDSTGYC